MKILVVTQYYYPEQFRITDISQTLVQLGHEVTVLTGQPNYPNGEIFPGYSNRRTTELLGGVKIIRCKIIPRKKGKINLLINYISFVYYGNKEINRIDKDFDVIFINQLSPIFSAIPAIKYSKKNGVKSILYCLDLWPESVASSGLSKKNIFYKLISKLSNNIYKNVETIAITSNAFSEKFLNIGIENTFYLPQYSEDIFKPLKNNKTSKTIDFVFAGNIGEFQSVETIIFAAELLSCHTNIIFHIVGDGSKYKFIRDLVEKKQLINIKFYGKLPLEIMPEIYNLADAMLVTLKNDEMISKTLPGKVQTYLASAKPIIAAINGETSNILKEACVGYVCPAEDYIELSNSILKFINEGKKNEFSFNALRYYEDHFSKEIFFKKLEFLLKGDYKHAIE